MYYKLKNLARHESFSLSEKINKTSRVPAFINGKGIQKGTYSNMMHITDIQITILDMIGHKRTGTKLVDGVSHWNELRRG